MPKRGELHIERTVIVAEKDEDVSLAELLRQAADVVEELERRPRGKVLTAGLQSPAADARAAIIEYRTEDEDELV